MPATTDSGIKHVRRGVHLLALVVVVIAVVVVVVLIIVVIVVVVLVVIILLVDTIVVVCGAMLVGALGRVTAVSRGGVVAVG